MTDEADDLTKIVSNFEKFKSFCEKIGDRSENVLALLEVLGERIATCPASSRDEFHNSFPGGLVDHSLRVLSLAVKLTKLYEFDIPKQSIILAALFHDIGKVGDLKEDHYISSDDWQKKRGQNYRHNPNLQFMTTAHRGLWLLQHFGIVLTQDEFLAILLNDGFEAEENKPYRMKESALALIIHQADRMACEFEKINRNAVKNTD